MIGPPRLSSLDILIPGVLKGFGSHEARMPGRQAVDHGDENKR